MIGLCRFQKYQIVRIFREMIGLVSHSSCQLSKLQKPFRQKCRVARSGILLLLCLISYPTHSKVAAISRIQNGHHASDRCHVCRSPSWQWLNVGLALFFFGRCHYPLPVPDLSVKFFHQCIAVKQLALIVCPTLGKSQFNVILVCCCDMFLFSKPPLKSEELCSRPPSSLQSAILAQKVFFAIVVSDPRCQI